MSGPERVAVLGAGSWGTALGALLAGKGHAVMLWSFESAVAREVNEGHSSPYLAGVRLPEELRASQSLVDVVRDADVVVSVSPSQFVRSVMREAAPWISEATLVVSASKGIEIDTLQRMDEVLGEVLPKGSAERLCVLSGPSFASEVAREAPTAVVVASRVLDQAVRAQALFQTEHFRVYTNADIVGVELAGALKNVIAVAAGVASGLGYRHNTLAAIITRGLAEITRLGVALGARQATFSGLAGLGDLLLTCTGELSRNRTVGFRLGQGERLEDILADMKGVAEGVKTAEAAHALATRHGVEMPITEQVYAIVHGGKKPSEALRALMLRDPKAEEWS